MIDTRPPMVTRVRVNESASESSTPFAACLPESSAGRGGVASSPVRESLTWCVARTAESSAGEVGS